MRAYHFFIVLIALGLVLSAPGAAAQNLVGRVTEEVSVEPLEGVRVVLWDTEDQAFGETFSDSDGRFSLIVPRPGEWVVTAELIGYGTARSAPLSVSPGDRLVLDVSLGIQPVDVGSITVVGTPSHENPDIREFYNRVEWGRSSGLGRFLTRSDIERSNALHPSELLRSVPGIRIVRRSRGALTAGNSVHMASGCVPAIFVDGTLVNRGVGSGYELDDLVAISSIEGVEVYRGASAHVGRFHDDQGCGLILVWTRRGVSEGDGFSFRGFLIGIGLVATIFLFN